MEVRTEAEAPRGWSYTVAVYRDSGTSVHTVTMAWCDHDYWCGGRLAPSRVVRAVVEYALTQTRELPLKFDAARVRHWSRTADDELKCLV